MKQPRVFCHWTRWRDLPGTDCLAFALFHAVHIPNDYLFSPFDKRKPRRATSAVTNHAANSIRSIESVRASPTKKNNTNHVAITSSRYHLLSGDTRVYALHTRMPSAERWACTLFILVHTHGPRRAQPRPNTMATKFHRIYFPLRTISPRPSEHNVPEKRPPNIARLRGVNCARYGPNGNPCWAATTYSTCTR